MKKPDLNYFKKLLKKEDAVSIMNEDTDDSDLMRTEDKTMAKITKDTIIGDILDIAPETAPIFFSIGMHCLGCPASRAETVEEACMVHGVDTDEILELVNQQVSYSVQ